MSGLFCIHGHFYQPAREHPWLEAVEVEDSAAPFHDWNARVTAECYAPNGTARILDERGRIVRIASNYEAISFDFGPTLMRWLERCAPDVYAQIIRADRRSLAVRGYGNAVAHPYHHVILPLAARRDKTTQVRWGIAEFRRRFGRPPEGMWLPETAVDLETLAVLAECGIAFTILAPHQAARVRLAPGGGWVDVGPGLLDTGRPYLCRPGPGLNIALFFYDGAAAHEIAFGPLLQDGGALAARLLGLAGDPELAAGRLVHVATDGETYGHHHRFGEMALAYAVRVLERAGGQMTNYAAFLADNPPTHEAQVHERTSWSCAHGIERWRADCGCRTRSGWHQRWRAPLREALDWLKGEADALFEEAGAGVFHDPWGARDGYIDVVLDRSEASVARFLAAWALRPGEAGRVRGTPRQEMAGERRATLSPEPPDDRGTALRLLEMQRHAMQMFASDGWFFDEISGIEAVQNLRHASRVLQLAASLGRGLETPFVERLRRAESNLPDYADGAAVYERLVRPAVVDARRVAAHYAITSLFQDYADPAEVYSYSVARTRHRRLTRGPHVLASGRAQVTAAATRENETLSYAVLHMGSTDVHCCVVSGWDDDTHEGAAEALAEVFESGTVVEVIRQMDASFGPEFYTWRNLFTEERRRVLARLSEETVAHLESSYRRLYHDSRGLMRSLLDADVPVPREFLVAAEFVVLTDLRRALAAPGALAPAAWDLLREARAWGVALPEADLEPLLRARIEQHLRDAGGPSAADSLAERSLTVDSLAEVVHCLDFARDTGIVPDLWQAQNLFATWLAPVLPQASGDLRAGLEEVADRLSFSMEMLANGGLVEG